LIVELNVCAYDIKQRIDTHILKLIGKSV